MTEPLYRGEAWLRNWSETAKGGRRITLQIDEDGLHPFKGYDGERFAIVIVPIGNDEKPMAKTESASAPARGLVGPERLGTDSAANAKQDQPATLKPKKRWHDMPASQRAGMLMNDGEFQDYAALMTGLLSTATTAEYFIKQSCRVDQKRLIVAEAAQRLDDIEGNFRAWQQARQLGAA